MFGVANESQAYPLNIIGSTWTVVNIPNLNARAMMSGLYVSVGNCGGLLSSNIYRTQEAPRYITSLRTNIAMSAVLMVGSASYSLWMRWENRRRDNKAGPAYRDGYSTEGVTSTRDPRFRFQA